MVKTTPVGEATDSEYGGHPPPPGILATAALGPSSATPIIPTTENSQHASVIMAARHSRNRPGRVRGRAAEAARAPAPRAGPAAARGGSSRKPGGPVRGR